LISVVPLDLIYFDTVTASGSGFNKFARFARIGKLYKIIKMMRLIRLLKIVKERNNIARYMTDILKLGMAFERFVFMLVIYLVFQHFIACMWVFVGKFDEQSK